MNPTALRLLPALLALPLCASRCDESQSSTDAASLDLEPRVRLRISGHLEGRLEPCGCASGQIGGLARRAFRTKRDRTWDLLIEGGNLTLGGTALDDMKLYTILNALQDKKTPYAAVGLGGGDFALGGDLIGGYASLFTDLPILATDVVATPSAAWPVKPFVEHEVNGAQVRIVSLAFAAPESNDAVKFEKLGVEAAWTRGMDGVGAETFRVVLGHGTTAEVMALGQLEPQPDLIVAVNQAHMEPPREAFDANGVPVVHPGVRGRYLLDVTLTREGGRPKLTRYEPIALAGSKSQKGAYEDADVAALILDHRTQVKDAGILKEMAGKRETANGARYVGSATCMGCHQDAWKAWSKSKHAGAWKTLEDAEESGRYTWPVTAYPDCVKCHTVGYEQVSGFAGVDATPLLGGVGCEECHGAGGDHIGNPTEVKLGDVPAQKCQQCHDFEQSPDFEYGARWKVIEHGK